MGFLGSLQDFRKIFIVILIIAVSILVLADVYSLKILSPVIIAKVKNTIMQNEIYYFRTDNSSVETYNTSKEITNVKPSGVRDEIRLLMEKEWKKMGYESIERHTFKSPYIINPPIYNDNISKLMTNDLHQKKTKIISLPNLGKAPWFKRFRFNSDNKYCKYKCEIDFEGKKVSIADLVIFVCRTMSRTPRKKGQLWAVFCWESAQHWGFSDYAYWQNQFNITMSYRLDADIFMPYVQLAWRDSSLLFKEKEYRKIAEAKTKTATWWVSNCRGDRYNFVKEMGKYIDIDIYGGCGKKLNCGGQKHDFECRKAFNTTYKFYLTFENSFCQDYVTEKFDKTFQDRTHIIPVVKGAANYDVYFPNNTFVNGNHFKNAKELALYLKDLANDIPRYTKMLLEKDRIAAAPYSQNIDWCQYCETLHTKQFGIKRNIKSWSHAQTCQTHKFHIV